MTISKEGFTGVFGKPNPSTPNTIHFNDVALEAGWELRVKKIGAGWFKNRFLYFFGPGLDRLMPCLEAWSFIVPPTKRERTIVGRNAYGALVVVEDGDDEDNTCHVLDPYLMVYWGNPNMHLLNFLGNFLPNDEIPGFLDDTLYQAWIKVRKKPLEDDMILAPKVPWGLGGQMDPENFQEEEIVDYYQTTGPIFAKAYAKMGKKPPSAKKPTRPKR
jgi:hypothetical protein